jgi:hypothetical protein
MPQQETESSEWLALVCEKFGAAQIVVHNSKVTQIEQAEKTRLGCAQEKLLEKLTFSY